MEEQAWFSDYFERYRQTLFEQTSYKDLIQIKEMFLKANKSGNKIIFAGNGGSAAMASHCTVDLTKNAGIRAINFNEADLITCFANDYGYENWISKAIQFYGKTDDVIVLISSSGTSKNIVNAIETSLSMQLKVITFSGFGPDNLIRKKGHVNCWVDSYAYNIVEMTHHIWLLSIIDMIIGSAEYSA
jgi:D-sedoheptulose 7-phosphate isomerase